MPRSGRHSAPRAIGSKASPPPRRRSPKSPSIARPPSLLGGPPGRLAGGERDPPEHVLPVAIARLAKQPRGRIPRAVIASGEPAPAGNLAQCAEGRLSEAG